MIDTKKTEKEYRLGCRLIAYSGIGAPVLASALEASDGIDPDKHPTVMVFLEIVTAASLWFYVLFFVLFVLGRYLTRKGDSLAWKTLQSQVDILQKKAFPDLAWDFNDNHRVTLFKYKKWNWVRLRGSVTGLLRGKLPAKVVGPWTGWLVPVIRSGHTGKDTKAIFWTPDDGRKSEGVAGQCWASDTTVIQPALPSIIQVSSEQNKGRYCRKCNMPRWTLDAYCESNRPLARSISAFPVRNASGDRWGVLVFDSMEPNGVNTEDAQKAFEVVIEPIGVLLEGV